MLVLLFFFSLVFFLVTYLGFLSYVRYQARKPWNLRIDKDFQPSISILVPAHNEEAVVEKKLTNLSEVSYPNSKIEVLVIDDASEDRTLEIVKSFIAQHPGLNIKVVKQYPRAGKSAGLNLTLTLSGLLMCLRKLCRI